MGLFEKKSKDKSREVDIVVDEEEEPAGAQRTAPPGSVEPRRPGERPSSPTAGMPTAAYGIEHVVQLMRTLPLDQNSELVAEVVRRTLESANVSIDAILADARHKEEEIHSRIDALTQAVEEMQREIAARRKHVADLQKLLAEIVKARDLLAAPVRLRGGGQAGEAGGDAAKGGRQDG
jgi:hypothetical protein